MICEPVTEGNLYARQKFSESKAELAKFQTHLISFGEQKAFIGINIITGKNKLSNLELYWASDEF